MNKLTILTLLYLPSHKKAGSHAERESSLIIFHLLFAESH